MACAHLQAGNQSQTKGTLPRVKQGRSRGSDAKGRSVASLNTSPMGTSSMSVGLQYMRPVGSLGLHLIICTS